MNRQLCIILICVSISFSFFYTNPSNKFPASPSEFLAELKAYVTASKQKKVTAIFTEFERKFKGNAFSSSQVDVIITTCNGMLENRMAAKPFFIDYLQTLNLISNTTSDEATFDNWHEVYSAMVADIEKRKLNGIKAFLNFSTDFFEHKALQYSTSGVNWIVEADQYQFVYKDKTPHLAFERLDLHCKRKKASITIAATSGQFFPIKKLWIGKEGKVAWEKDNKEEIYCTFGNYEINVTKSLYQVKEAELHFPSFFPDGPIKGKFEDKVVIRNKKTESSYPRFSSDKHILEIKNLGPGINYKGGFQLEGNTIRGNSSKEHKATLTVDGADGKPAFKSKAESMAIRIGEQISGEQVATVLYTFAKDSIFHPSVKLKFDIPSNVVHLTRGKRGSDRNPFFDSYHKVNIDSDRISWFLGPDSIVINQRDKKIRNAAQSVTFESLNYFDVRDYRRLQNVSTHNPIALLKEVATAEGKEFKAITYAQKINPSFDVSSIKSLLYDLLEDGFIWYDSDQEIIRVQDKVIHYADASQGKVDYDNIRFISDSEGTNAVMDTKTKQILAHDVRVLELSSTRKVAARPAHDQVMIKENRNMDFDGRLFAGFGTLEGKDFHFEYDPFNVLIDSLRYFDLFIPTGELDRKGNPVAFSIASRIEHTSGILLIDAPANKSGKDKINMFPAFNTKSPSYVYYNRAETQDSCYSRDNFYFELQPFNFNSLNNFTKEDLHFDGTMFSADIFPEFKETLLLNEEDQSLGFSTKTTEKGFDNYKGKGTFTGEISLSNKGLLANGNLKYLWASIDSDAITYRPNRMMTSAQQFELSEDRSSNVQIPEVAGKEVAIEWKPYKDSMYIQSEKEPFQLFKAPGYKIHNLLILTPGGLKGKGVFDWERGSVRSNLYSFGAFSAEADTADLSIRSSDLTDLALNTNNVYTKLDFDEQIGTVKANADTVTTVLPYNKYITSMNEYDWDMKNQTITFKSDENSYGNFRSTDSNQDSLNFKGKTAFYDLKTSELKIGGIPHIVAADAYVYPEEGNVEVAQGGKMTRLENARIVADTINKYHVINKATVEIKGRKEYHASGFYEYNIGDRKQEIEFANIVGERVGKGKRSAKQVLTKAEGEVKEADGFYIDAKTAFQGKISLQADSRNLSFDGFARLDVPALPEQPWFSIKSHGDKNKLAISYTEPKSFTGHQVHTGLFINRENGHLYPRVMMPIKHSKDREIFSAKGLFTYDSTADKFMFGDSLKITVGVKPGNVLDLTNSDGGVTTEGKFSLAPELPAFHITTAGRAKTTFSDNTGGLKLDLMAGFEFWIPEKLIKIMTSDLQSSSFDAQIIDYKRETKFFERALAEFIDDPKALHFAIGNMKNSGLDLPSKHDPYTLFFSHLPLEWKPEFQSFISTREKLAFSSIGGEVINRWLQSVVEIRMPGNHDDHVKIYLKSPSDFYYYFSYKKGVLSIASNNQKFNEELDGLKDKARIKKLKGGETIEIQAVESAAAQMFLKKVNMMKK